MSARVTQMDKCFCQDIPEWETQQWCKTKHVPIWTDADAYELSYITKVCMNQYNMPHEKHMNVSGFPPEVADFQPSCSRAENLSFFSVQLNREVQTGGQAVWCEGILESWRQGCLRWKQSNQFGRMNLYGIERCVSRKVQKRKLQWSEWDPTELCFKVEENRWNWERQRKVD